MFRPLELYVGLRYTRAKRRNHFISFITLTSMLGIGLGVAALITVLSVMNGFERELRERILGLASHATVSAYGGALEGWESAAAQARRHAEVRGVAPFIQREAMLTHGGLVRGALVRGVDPAREPQVSQLGGYMLEGELGRLADGDFGIILGRELARGLAVRTGDKVTLVAPQALVTPAGVLPRLKRFTVVGVFEAGHAQYDSGLALVHLADAGRMFRLGESITGLRVKLRDLFDAPTVSRELAAQLGGALWVRDWTQHHANFFRALRIEKTTMFVILTLIVAVAAFNIVSTLIMVVTDKQSDIAILRTLGASPASVMAIFVVLGTVIGVFGTLLGTAGGVALAANVETLVAGIERLLGIQFLDANVYYISEVPSEIEPADVVLISTVAFGLSVLATLYPAWRASRTQPAEALRYE